MAFCGQWAWQDGATDGVKHGCVGDIDAPFRVAGGIAGALLKGFRAVVAGAAIPWCGMLTWLLYNEYFVPYQGGGASMWPIAQLFGGTFAAVIGAVTATVVRSVKSRPGPEPPYS